MAANGLALDHGWTTVPGHNQGHPDRLPPAQREPFEKSVIKKWESSSGHWSGMGKHPDFGESKEIHHKIDAHREILGSGAYGRVEKVKYRSVCLARKWIPTRRSRSLEILRSEADVMEKLDHEHIVKLIGTYTFRPRELYLLLWPVAVCNLSEILADIEYLRNLRNEKGDQEDMKRLDALGLTDISAVKIKSRDAAAAIAMMMSPGGQCPLTFLQRIMGCIGQAVAYCHRAKIRHLDIKPTNILLNPGRVYLADFGIARDVADQEMTTTIGHQGTPKWRAPEICGTEDWSMRAAEIYSLGLIYLNIATAVYNGSLTDFDAVLDDPAPDSRAERLRDYQHQLALEALATQEFQDFKAPTVTPRHILDLTQRMLSLEPAARPNAFQVDMELVDLGGIDQVYHGLCCRKSARHVASRIDNRLSAVQSQNSKLVADNERLKKENAALAGADETHKMRLANEKETYAKYKEILTKQCEEEKTKRRALEERIKDMEMQAGKRHTRTGISRADTARESRIAYANPENSGLGIRMRARTHPATKAAVQPPPPKPSPYSSSAAAAAAVPLPPTIAARVPTDPIRPAWQGRNPAAVMSSIPAPALASAIPRATDSPSPNPQTPTATLPSRGSVSRLPVFAKTSVTSRSSTPRLGHDPSLTDSTQASMSSSVFSHRSVDTGTEATQTPPAVSPAVKQVSSLSIPIRDIAAAAAQPAPPDNESFSPTFSTPPPSVSSVLSSSRTTRADAASVAGSEMSYEGLSSVRIPALQPMKSWAAVAGEAKAWAKIVIGSPPKVSSVVSPTTAPGVGRERSRARSLAGS